MMKATNESVWEGIFECCSELATGSQFTKCRIILGNRFSSSLVPLGKMNLSAMITL